jgi:peptide deformylase
LKKYELKIYPDPVLRKISSPVLGINNIVRHLIKKMSKIMYSRKGIGLAAPQVGTLERVIIADIGEGLISMINPEILTGYGEDYIDEGCLSLPDTVVNVKRKQSVFVRYLDKNEKEKESELDGLTARVIQHEIDHLNGVLIIDHAPLVDRLNIKSKLMY